MFETALNFRLLGASELAPSRRLRPALLYRSGDLGRLSPQDASQVAGALGIRTYLDLRSEDEVIASGPPQALLEQGVEWRRLAVDGYSGEAISVEQPGPSEYARYYLEMLEARAECFIEAIEVIALR